MSRSNHSAPRQELAARHPDSTFAPGSPDAFPSSSTKRAVYGAASWSTESQSVLRDPIPQPGFVLTMASYYGSLAATRCLGARGVPVIVADAHRFAPARWSRHVTRRERCPPPRPVARLIQWLIDFGDRNPGHVLYATSDDLAWAFAEHQSELRRNFRLLSPSFESVGRVLDKASLHDACLHAGLHVPRTWFPRDGEVESVVRDARFPLIVKPRTQVHFTSMVKGTIVRSPDELRRTYGQFSRRHRYESAFSSAHPDIERPMVQEFHAGAPIYAISGYCDPARKLFVARGSRKLIQWPRQAGVGIAFGDAPVDETLAKGIRRLCEQTGFFGVFEAEFLVSSSPPRLIDFNPRFFGQMGFDAARGLPSPYFVYLAAIGNDEVLEREVRAAQEWRPQKPMLYINRAALAWTQAAEWVVGRAPASLAAMHATGTDPCVVGAVNYPGDLAPALIDGLGQIVGALSHPRSSLRMAARGH